MTYKTQYKVLPGIRYRCHLQAFRRHKQLKSVGLTFDLLSFNCSSVTSTILGWSNFPAFGKSVFVRLKNNLGNDVVTVSVCHVVKVTLEGGDDRLVLVLVVGS